MDGRVADLHFIDAKRELKSAAAIISLIIGEDGREPAIISCERM